MVTNHAQDIQVFDYYHLVVIKTEFRSQEPEFRMNSVRLADESRGLRPPLNRSRLRL
jgi:hypothetical protein